MLGLFWSCPFIFTIVEILLIRYNDSFCLDNNKSIWSFIIPIIDGAIFFGFQTFLLYFLKSINVNFSTCKDLMNIIIIFFVIFLGVLLFLIFCDEIEIPIIGTIMYSFVVFLVVFFFVGIGATLRFEDELDKMDFQYEKTETINLSSMSGEMGTSGSVKGNFCYINGVFDTNYRIYYVEKEEDGNLVIDYVDYDKEHVKIYENNNETPRLEIISYKKELINPENGNVIVDESYKDFVFYIPEGTYNNTYNSGF